MDVRPRALLAALACLPFSLSFVGSAAGHSLFAGQGAQVRQGVENPNITANSTIYVATTGSDSNNGESLAAAKLTIQAGITAVASSGTVYVEPGTYSDTFNSSVSLPASRDYDMDFGGNITVRSDPANNGTPANTIINLANQSVYGFIFDSSETSSALLEGLTIENGNQDGGNGGAIHISEGSSPTIENCIFVSNQSALGGAIYMDDTNAVVRECTFVNNAATDTNDPAGPASGGDLVYGGAIEIATDSDGTNGANYQPIVTNCVFYGNTAPTDGGAIDISGNDGYGGNTNTLSPAITNCTFTKNTSVAGTNEPGGTLDVFGATPTITNCIVYGDSDSGNEINNLGDATITTKYDDIEQSGFDGPGDTNRDPGFNTLPSVVNQSAYDLAPGSQEIGAGTLTVPTGVDISHDRNGNPRTGTVDVGAYQSPDTPPAANAQTVNVLKNTATAVTLTGTAANSLHLDYTIATQPSHGTLSGTAPNLTYTPASNYTGSDSFTFSTSYDSGDTGSPATVTLTVKAPATAPMANSQTVSVPHDSSGTAITLTGTDTNTPVETLTFNTPSSPAHGTLSGFNASTGAVTYTPNSGYHGTDTFTFTVTNTSSLTSSPAGTVTLNVAVGTPTANAQSVNASENASANITLTSTDDDTPALALTYIIGTGPAHGMLSGTAPNLIYTPNTGYSGPDSFTFTVSNGTNTSAAATVSITVSQVTATVTGASVTWGSRTAALQTAADGLRLLPAGRTTDMPWLGINQLTITLSQAETLSPSDVSVTGLTVANYGPVTVSGSGTTYTITLAQPINAADRVTVTIGNANIATYTRRLDVLPGDVGDAGNVSASSMVLARNAIGTGNAFADINGDNAVNVTDYNLVRMDIGNTLP